MTRIVDLYRLHIIKRPLNAILRLLGIRIARVQDLEDRPWDKAFKQWLDDAKRQGMDPNDVADVRWGNVRHLVDKYYLPHITSRSKVMELGPGTGRVTRHIANRCGHLVVVDFSRFVVEWMQEYLPRIGVSDFSAYQIADCSLAPIADETVDVIVADGVFHHIDLEDFHRYFVDFKRALVPGGIVVVNFVNFMASEGYTKFRQHAEGTNQPDVFRWHHPDVIEALCSRLQFEQVKLTHERVKAGDFVCYVSCRKPNLR